MQCFRAMSMVAMFASAFSVAMVVYRLKTSLADLTPFTSLLCHTNLRSRISAHFFHIGSVSSRIGI
jgi:hypothetical protein